MHVVEAQYAETDVAADAGVASRGGQDVVEQSRGCRLAVGAGDEGDLGALVGGSLSDRAGQKLHVADDFDAGLVGFQYGPVGFRVSKRYARRQHQGGKLCPIGGVQVDQR